MFWMRVSVPGTIPLINNTLTRRHIKSFARAIDVRL